MKKITLEKLSFFTIQALRAAGMNEDHARKVSDIYIRTTLRGVGHHDIADFNGRINGLTEGRTNPNPEFRLLSSTPAVEIWDGDNGLGEICSCHITERAQELAARNGIGYAVIKQANHFLASYPYVQKAAEEGFVAIIYCHTRAVMPAPYGQKHVIGNSPMGYGIPSHQEPVIFDASMASCSYGEINKRIREGKTIPEHWARDKEGNPTSDPHVVIDKTGTITAAAEHKGYGLSILTEALTAVMADGPVIDQAHEDHEGVTGVYSLSVICIDPRQIHTPGLFEGKVQDMQNRMHGIDENVRMPGERSQKQADMIKKSGSVELEDGVIDKINVIADKLKIQRL